MLMLCFPMCLLAGAAAIPCNPALIALHELRTAIDWLRHAAIRTHRNGLRLLMVAASTSTVKALATTSDIFCLTVLSSLLQQVG